MCKCKSFWESCYWHCCEKHFCWDEQIALYEEEKENTHVEPPNVGFDNLAFYDNVALIANRAIFTIEPLSTNNQKPVVEQPKKKLRWFEDEEIQNHINETRSLPQKKMSIVPEESDTSSIDTLDMVDGKKETNEPPIPNNNTNNNNQNDNKNDNKNDNTNDNNNSNDCNNKSIISPRPTVELRKKSLTQRRLSRALTLQIDRKELPLIRQSSMPKFYLDTPEVNQIDSCVARTPSITLNTPIRPQSHEFNYDLSSVVQIQREQANAKPVRSEVRRATSLKERIKRQSSLVSLTSSIAGNYM